MVVHLSLLLRGFATLLENLGRLFRLLAQLNDSGPGITLSWEFLGICAILALQRRFGWLLLIASVSCIASIEVGSGGALTLSWIEALFREGEGTELGAQGLG